jgi:tetratricopeptide (TPR) repeat protein
MTDKRRGRQSKRSQKHAGSKPHSDKSKAPPQRGVTESLPPGFQFDAPAVADNAAHQAQTVMYDAWETPNRKQRTTLAHKALELWPDCADAWALLAEETATTQEQALEFYRRGVLAGERAIGQSAFKQDVGHFWGLLETRPYMRARCGLAEVLALLGRHAEAIAHYHDLLRLNPNDNQGIRYLLLHTLVGNERNDEAEALLIEFDDGTAEWLYAKALLAFRRQGRTPQTDALLKEGLAANALAPDFLLGRKRLPARLPDCIGFGDRDEAVALAAAYKTVWQQTPGAVDWLKALADNRRNNP